MELSGSFPVGTDIKTKTVFVITGTQTKQDPDDQKAYITIENISGTEILVRTQMTREDVGIYYYWWDSSSVERGIYKIIVDATFSGHTYVTTSAVELK